MPKIFSYLHRPPQSPIKEFGASHTQQSFKKECDINYIVKRFADTGFVDPTKPAVAQPQFVDLTELVSLESRMEIVNRVRDYFQSLPSEIREEFRNSPAMFAQFASVPENFEYLNKILGDRFNVNPPITTPPVEQKPSDPAPAPVENSGS